MTDINIRISKAAYERMRKRAWKEKKSIKDLIDELSKPKRGVPVRALEGV